MGLVSIVKDCWNTLGYLARPALLVPAVLIGGFVSSLYAQDEMEAIKPKDLSAYAQKDREEQKKEEGRKAEEKRAKEAEEARKHLEERKKEQEEFDRKRAENAGKIPSFGDIICPKKETGSSSPGDEWKQDSRKISDLFRANYTAETGDVVLTAVDHRLDLAFEGIRDDAYGKITLSGVNEQGKNNGSEFCAAFRGYGPAGEEDQSKNDVKFYSFFDKVTFGTAEISGNAGFGLESRILSAFLSVGGGFRNDKMQIFYATPFAHHGTSKRLTADAPFSAGIRLGNELGFELKGDIAYHHFQKEDLDVPYLDSPPTLMDVKDIRKGGDGDAILSLFYDPESKDCFLKLIAKYYQYNMRLTGGLYNKDETPLHEYKIDSLHEEYLVNLYGFFDFSGKDDAPDALGMFNLYYNGNNTVSQFGVHIAAGFRSDKNPIARHLIEKNQSLFTLRQMRAEKDIQDVAYNSKNLFHYDFGFGIIYQEPMPGVTSYPRMLYTVIEANLFQCTKIGNLGLNIQGRIDTIRKEHPGSLQIQANLFGPLSLALFYSLEFNDVSKLSAADGAKHTLGTSIGVNF